MTPDISIKTCNNGVHVTVSMGNGYLGSAYVFNEPADFAKWMKKWMTQELAEKDDESR